MTPRRAFALSLALTGGWVPVALALALLDHDALQWIRDGLPRWWP